LSQYLISKVNHKVLINGCAAAPEPEIISNAMFTYPKRIYTYEHAFHSPSREFRGYIPYMPASCWTILTIAGTDENATVIVPNKPSARLEKAAARGSVTRSSAVAMAEELPPSVTPRVI
jgi:hypothetical protein